MSCLFVSRYGFLVDENLSRRLPELLGSYGHDAVHVADAGLRSASDDEVLEAARREHRILISADTDFGTVLRRPVAPRNRPPPCSRNCE